MIASLSTLVDSCESNDCFDKGMFEHTDASLIPVATHTLLRSVSCVDYTVSQLWPPAFSRAQFCALSPSKQMSQSPAVFSSLSQR